MGKDKGKGPLTNKEIARSTLPRDFKKLILSTYKWLPLIDYLNSIKAKPDKVFNLVKQSFGAKNKPKDDDYNQLRRTWSLFVVSQIYNKSGVPEKEKKNVKIGDAISYFVESEAYQISYDMMHPVKTYNKKLKKYEWNVPVDSKDKKISEYKKKSQETHIRACRKLWDSDKGKLLRKELKKTKGKIPLYYKGELNAIFKI
tara:strand:- start:254 stop:853 length:600 start_codon:yes stop_codon:yes gene_type:complete